MLGEFRLKMDHRRRGVVMYYHKYGNGLPQDLQVLTCKSLPGNGIVLSGNLCACKGFAGDFVMGCVGMYIFFSCKISSVTIQLAAL